MTDSSILHLDLQLQRIYRDWIAKCHDAGIATRVTTTWRSGLDQDTAKAKGLSNAAAGESPHNCCDEYGSPASKAFDYACFNEQAHYISDGTDWRYKKAGEIGESLGLAWGGRWHHPDYDHLELPDWRNA